VPWEGEGGAWGEGGAVRLDKFLKPNSIYIR
jgi:hypothetical protein